MAVYTMWIGLKRSWKSQETGRGGVSSLFGEAGRMGQWNGRRGEGEGGQGEKSGKRHEGRNSLLGDKKAPVNISTWLHRWRRTATVGLSRNVVCSQTRGGIENISVCVDAYVCAHETRGSVGTEVGKGRWWGWMWVCAPMTTGGGAKWE